MKLSSHLSADPEAAIIEHVVEPVRGVLRRHSTRTLLVLVGSALFVRFIWLASFPEIQADEGLWTNSSKNFVAFGDWFMDGRTHMLLSPVFHAASVAVFALFRPTIAAARAVSAVAGGLSVLFLYLLTRRVSERRDLALAAAILFGVDGLSILLSRYALVESLELCLCLAAGVLLAQRWRWASMVAGVAFGLALLTKLNIAFLLLVFSLFLFLRPTPDGDRLRLARLRHAAVFALVGVLLAGSVYGALYAMYPVQFVQAFAFELNGVHFEGISHPIFRLGRFGVDAIQASHTVSDLFRQSPFLMVLAVCGGAVSLITRPRGVELFGPWLMVGVAFFLGQMFQPVRYFYLVSPALAFFAAVAVESLGAADMPAGIARRRVRATVLGLYVVFNLGYVGMGVVANRGTMLQQVVTWARAKTQPDERIMAAGYLCTDLPNRCYAHYHLAHDMAQLIESIRTHRIDYVIYDSGEWHHDLGDSLARHFAPVQRWAFGAVYRVTPRPVDCSRGANAGAAVAVASTDESPGATSARGTSCGSGRWSVP